MIGEHDRRDGHLDAWRLLNRRVSDDLDLKRGDIKRPRWRFAYYDSKIHTLSARALKVLPFLRRRA
jgi:hypothetical protein